MWKKLYKCENYEEMHQHHNKLKSIIGTEQGLGVESLQGAGKIAAETSIAKYVGHLEPF